MPSDPTSSSDLDDACSDERSLFERTAAAQGEPDLEDARIHAAVKARLFGRPPASVRLDRFTLIERLGEGGAGEVWAAYDPRLDRRVAIKVLHARGHGDQAAGRLIREARVAGRLSHPNIVSVFDVGTFEGRVFLAMEYIEGQDLAHWLAHAQPRPAQLLDVFVQAGRGLAEAHRHGIVHRDFKPANVMLQPVPGGLRARVVDFGLAYVDERSSAEHRPSTTEHPTGSDSDLTRTGQRMGTPAYMAPEQYDGRPVDARTDQFSFCVALYEGLVGRRPFTALGTFEVPPDGMAPVPRRLRAALRRGLWEDPTRRWPSMDALLAAIAPRRRWVGPAAGLGVLSLGALAVLSGSREPSCSSPESALPGWSPARRATIERAVAESPSYLAAGSWARLEPPLEAFVERWHQVDIRVCERGRAGTLSGSQHDRARACLSRAQHRFEALLDRLEHPTTKTLESAVPIAMNLHTVERCADPATPELGVALPHDPALAAAVARGRARLVEVRVATDLGETSGSSALLDRARAAVEPERDPFFDAELDLEQGRVLGALGRHADAAEHLEQVYRSAETAGHDLVKLEAAIALVDALWHISPERARWWASAAVAIAERIDPHGWTMFRALSEVMATVGNLEDDEAAGQALERMTALAEGSSSTPLWSARLWFHRAEHGLRQGRLRDAQDDAERARATFSELLGPAHPQTLQSQLLLGTALRQDQSFDRARLHFEAVAAQRTALHGPEHPSVAAARIELAVLADLSGDLAEAESAYLEALPIVEASQGADSLQVTTILENLGIVLARRGRFEKSVGALERALSIVQQRLGPEHSTVAFSHHNLANVHLDAGHVDEAREHALRAVDLRRRTLGPTHPKLAMSLGLLAGIEQRRGELVAARAAVDEAVAAVEAGLGPDSPQLMWLLERRARIALDAGDQGTAEAELRRALAIDRGEPERGDPDDAASVRFSLARLTMAKGEHEAALALAREALSRWQALGEGAAEQRREVERWLAEHEPERK